MVFITKSFDGRGKGTKRICVGTDRGVRRICGRKGASFPRFGTWKESLLTNRRSKGTNLNLVKSSAFDLCRCMFPAQIVFHVPWGFCLFFFWGGGSWYMR